MPHRRARALAAAATFALVAALGASAVWGAVPPGALVPLLLATAVVGMVAQFALLFAGYSPAVERVAEQLSADSGAGSARWSVGGRGESSALTDGFALAAVPASAPIHGATRMARVTISFERARIAGPVRVPLTVVSVDGPSLRGVVAAYRGTGGRDASLARFAADLGSPRRVARQWTVAASRDGLAALPGIDAALEGLSEFPQAAIWSRGASRLVIPGHVVRASTLLALIAEAADMNGRAATR